MSCVGIQNEAENSKITRPVAKILKSGQHHAGRKGETNDRCSREKSVLQHFSGFIPAGIIEFKLNGRKNGWMIQWSGCVKS